MDIARVLQLLPHRFPFLLVDRVLESDGSTRLVAIKNVTINEPFFPGHFPGHPVMPGVLIVEALAQAAGLLLLDGMPGAAGKVVYFLGIDGARFRKPVVPGDQLRLEITVLQHRAGVVKFSGKALVDGQVACDVAEMLARVMDA